MNLTEAKKAYEDCSQKLSDIVRQLAFAGIGVVWIFRISNSDKSIIPEDLNWTLFWLIITLILDVTQYLISSGTWYVIYYIHKHKVKNKGKDDDGITLDEKERWNLPSWLAWGGKVITLCISYILLAMYIYDKLG